MAKWSVPLAKLAKKTGADIDTLVRKSTFDLFSRAVAASPVDTGRFRANWNVSFGAVDAGTSDGVSPARADAEIRKVLAQPAGNITYLTNSLPYAIPLEYGHSQQAPNGMVRLAALQWRQAVQAALKKA